MRNLRGMSKLATLWLSNTRVGDAGLRHLTGLPLQMLSLSRTEVTGRGFKGLTLAGESPAEIWLDGCPVDDEGLHWIAQLRHVCLLSLTDTKVTDKGLESLAEFDDGCEVLLRGTSISDAGLKRLRARKGAITIHVGGTDVTDAGAAELMAACPGYKVCVRDCKMCMAAGRGRAGDDTDVDAEEE
jgi:hypothetical protein